MRIIISPAKKMNVDVDSFACQGLPQFLPKTEQLYERLRGMSYEELKALWKCNDQIAKLNYERLQSMDLRQHPEGFQLLIGHSPQPLIEPLRFGEKLGQALAGEAVHIHVHFLGG